MSLPATDRRERRKQEIRSRIESAAYQLFRENGVEATSIEQVCNAADVARRTFYSYFSNKQDLLSEMGVHRLYSQAEPMFAELMGKHSSTRERLSAMIDYIESNFQDFDALDRQLILMAPSRIARATDEQMEMGQSTMKSFAQMLRTGQQQGDVNDQLSAELLAIVVIGTLNTLTINWAHSESFPLVERLEEARSLFEQIICREE